MSDQPDYYFPGYFTIGPAGNLIAVQSSDYSATNPLAGWKLDAAGVSLFGPTVKVRENLQGYNVDGTLAYQWSAVAGVSVSMTAQGGYDLNLGTVVGGGGDFNVLSDGLITLAPLVSSGIGGGQVQITNQGQLTLGGHPGYLNSSIAMAGASSGIKMRSRSGSTTMDWIIYSQGYLSFYRDDLGDVLRIGDTGAAPTLIYSGLFAAGPLGGRDWFLNGHWIDMGGGSIVNQSDAAEKEDRTPVDDAQLLARLAGLVVDTWRWSADLGPGPERHIGPTAQAWDAAFPEHSLVAAAGARHALLLLDAGRIEDGLAEGTVPMPAPRRVSMNEQLGVALAGVAALARRMDRLEAAS